MKRIISLMLTLAVALSLLIDQFNSTALDCSHKFNNYWNTYQTIRKINDRLSREHGLSVIEKPKEKGKHYAEWANARRGTSWKDKLRRTIDRVLPTVSSYEEFLAAMRREGYEIDLHYMAHRQDLGRK